MDDPRQVLELVVLIIGLASLAGAAFAVLRSKAITTQNEQLRVNLDAFGATNGELRDQLNFERSERQREHGVFVGQLHAQDVECKQEIAKLQGRVEAYESGLAERLISAVAGALVAQQSKDVKDAKEAA